MIESISVFVCILPKHEEQEGHIVWLETIEQEGHIVWLDTVPSAILYTAKTKIRKF